MSWYEYIEKRCAEGFGINTYPLYAEGKYCGVILYIFNRETVETFDTNMEHRVVEERIIGKDTSLMDVWKLTKEECKEIDDWFKESIRGGYWEMIPNTPEDKQCWEWE